MITIFNRKELLATFSMEQQSEIRRILAERNIDYQLKTVNRNSPSPWSDMRARTGSLGQNMEIVNEYIIYVKKSDYPYAVRLLKG